MKYTGTKTKYLKRNDCDIFDRDIRRRPVRARTVQLSKRGYREQYEKALELIQNLGLEDRIF
jgi:CRISPR/Cas system-associated protein Cas5 (RAMP superfamily)